jgi:chromosome segregation ATPase
MANLGGIYFWTQHDFNILMAQLAALQTSVTQINKAINRVAAQMGTILTQEQKQMSALDDLKAAVEQTQNVEQSAVTLIQGIAKQLSDALSNNQAANNDPALQQLRDQLNSSAAELGAAVTANTPAQGGGGQQQPDPNAPQVNPLSGRR